MYACIYADAGNLMVCPVIENVGCCDGLGLDGGVDGLGLDVGGGQDAEKTCIPGLLDFGMTIR
jgi:hypothetical protein